MRRTNQVIDLLENLLITNLIWVLWASIILGLLLYSKQLKQRDLLNLLYISYIGLPILLLFQIVQDYVSLQIYIPQEIYIYEMEIVTAVAEKSEVILPFFPIIYLFTIIGFGYIFYNLKKLLKYEITQINKYDQLLDELKSESKIKREVKIYTTNRFNSPMSFGWFKKRIILPEQILKNISDDKIRFILLHEMLHLRNHDFIKNIFQKVTRVLFFYNPLVVIMDKLIDKHREFACDEDVINILPQKKMYASTLLDLHNDDMLNVAMANQFIGSKHILKQRIQQMSLKKTKNRKYFRNYVIIIVISFTYIACQSNVIDESSPNTEIVKFFDVQEKPMIIKKVKPKYPKDASFKGIEGMVVLDFVVNEDGTPSEIKILKSVPELDKAAIEALEQYRFTPGTIDGKAVKVNWRVPFRFRLKVEDSHVVSSDEQKEIFSGRKLKEKPVLLKKVLPKYPKEAAKKGIEGTVKVSCTINKSGKVEGAHVFEGEGIHELNQAAIDAINMYEFEPVIIDGKAVYVSMVIPVKFVLKD